MPICECGEHISTRHMDAHRQGRRHRARTRNNQQDVSTQGDTSSNDSVPVSPNDGSRHAANQRARESPLGIAGSARDNPRVSNDTERDTNGITISWEDGQVDFGVLEASEVIGSGLQMRSLTIRRVRRDVRVHLKGVKLRNSQFRDASTQPFTIYEHDGSNDGIIWVSSEVPFVLPVHFSATHDGRFTDTLELTFWDVISQETFMVTRRLLATVGSQEDYERLRPRAPYVHSSFNSDSVPLPVPRVIPAGRPPTWTPTEWGSRLPEFPIPASVAGRALNSDGIRAVREIMPPSLCLGTYGEWFQILLWVEEERRRLELQKQNLKDKQLTRKDPNYSVQIPGLLDKKPQILVGDKIVIQRMADNKSWEGRVHAINGKDVRLRLSSDFSLYGGDKFDIVFQLNRMPFRRMHQAVLTKPPPERIVFPTQRHILQGPAAAGSAYQTMVDASPLIKDDPEKLRAVWTIVNQPAGSVPFVLHGPPGTGKTTGITEAIRHLLAKDKNNRVLACAQSNRAADTIAVKLIRAGLPPAALLRLNAVSRPFDDPYLPEELLPYCPVNGNNVFATPSLEDLKKYRVVVSTLVSGGVPQALGVKRGHYSHVFIDEAGQAVEPETMIPILLLVNGKTNVVLAGDDKQLGPVITSKVAAALGYKDSFLDRIMKMDIYDINLWKDITIVQLLRQYRAHRHLMDFTSQQWYDDRLQHCADPSITHQFLNSRALVKRGYPVVFHGINGRELREDRSPSYFNIDEATLVKTYCTKLEADHPDLSAHDVGIITPYLAQRNKIRDILPAKFKDAKVGTVEEFQGQERLVIIVSTVRSNENNIGRDIRHALGFVASPRRTNVVLSRARALLIVIGDPFILSLDPTWRAWIARVLAMGGYRGIPFSLDAPAEDDGEEERDPEQAERMERIQAQIIRREGLEGVLEPEEDGERSDDEVVFRAA